MHGLWYSRNSLFKLVAYTDSDYAGATQDRKSTTGGCQFLGNRLISWQCKKQTVVAIFTTKAEYVAAASCCGQVLWIQNQQLDYGYNFMNTMIHIDNNSTICIIENPVQHSKTKHIEIRHHFIRDCNAKKLIQMVKIDTEHNVADLLTKGFDAGRFQYLVGDKAIHKELGDRMERAATTASSLEVEQDSGSGPRVNKLGSGEDSMKLMELMAHYTKLSDLNLNQLSIHQMATLEFCDKHNMVAYLEKPEGSVEFHQIINFLTASHIHYALIENPTIYTSFIKQFWTTATASTNVNGEVELTASIDGQAKTITEASLRRHLKLEDNGGITSLPNTEIFEQLALMGALSTSPPPITETTPTIEEPAPMPHESPLQSFTNKVRSLENELKNIKKVLLEDEVVEEDSSKQGRSLIEELDMDADISSVPPHAKIQEKASDETEVSTADTALNTANIPISTASETPEVSTAAESLVYIRSAKKKKDKGKTIMIEDESVQKKSKKQVQEERLGHEEAIRLQEQIDKEERKRIARDAEIAKQLQEEYDKARKKEAITEDDTAHVIDWNDPSVIRYHALQNRPRSVAEVRKNMMVWDQIHSFVLMDSEEEVQRLKRADAEIFLELQKYMHGPLNWWLYDTCDVHHVSTEKGQDIFMLVEKDYPLIEGLATLMLVNKLRVDQHSEMADEL
ncbi:hypothetical protein Tco_0614858 [Tanacetum coccineum]